MTRPLRSELIGYDSPPTTWRFWTVMATLGALIGSVSAIIARVLTGAWPWPQ
jgi:hypothetical protein